MSIFGLPKSCKKVLLVLSSSDSLTQKEIKEKTGLSIRSVKESLKLLKERDLVEEHFVLGDIRRKKYLWRGENVK